MGATKTVLRQDRPGIDREKAVELAKRLQDKALALVRFLGARKYLSTPQTGRLFADKDRYTTNQRLGRLRKKMMVYGQRQTFMRGIEPRPPNVWFLDWNGYYAYRERWPNESLSWDPRYMSTKSTMRHSILVSEVWVRACEAAADEETNVAAVAWLDEWDLAYTLGGEEWFRPDALLVLRVADHPVGYAAPYQAVRYFSRETDAAGRNVRFHLDTPAEETAWKSWPCWIEVDRGTESPVRHKEKAQLYRRAIVQQASWNRRFGMFGLVLVLTTEGGRDDPASRAQTLARAWAPFALTEAEHKSPRAVAGKRPVGVATWESLEQHGLLGPIWWAIQSTDKDGKPLLYSEPIDLLTLAGRKRSELEDAPGEQHGEP